ncbi:MAG TPA: SDR family NAD(P)-dependent oxidoreductase [Mycobacteriales bacterium]|jgi:NAD(P)-dependent dehydrogenase (short-subunit alcohol dehydrogenase family)|nr:SDR family NAD(P)-dependent oxidoreductase [Mycobacteriales bacterium]
MTIPGPSPADVPRVADWSRLLADRTAVVTGGGAGIGQAICLLFAQHGAHVELADIDLAAARDTIAQITTAGGSARCHELDVTQPDAVARFAAAVLADHPQVSVLVNNVGDYRPLVRFADSSAESWQTMYAINLQHIFAVTHSFLPAMVRQRRGSIVNVHSVEAMRGYPGDPVYGAMKAGAAAFTTDLAISVGRHGVRVNGIGPDLIQTPQVDYLTGYEEQSDLWPSWAPAGRLGWPTDIARVALFLASDLSSYVTGHNIPVDGGSLAGGRWFFSPNEGRFVNRPRRL